MREDGFGGRSLEGHLGDLTGTIADLDAGNALGLFFKPRDQFLTIGSVDAEKIFMTRDMVDKNIVLDPALVVADHGVLRLQRRERGDVVGRQPLQKRECFPSRDDDPSHMADVEETGLSPNGLVLVHHAGILDRHFPAGKIDQLGTRRDMSFKNRGMFHGKATGSAVSG